MPVFSFKQWTDRTWVAALVFVSLLVLLPGFFSIPPVDRDETRFAQSTRQMVATGTVLDIPFQDGKRYKKPIGIYWLQAIPVNLYGVVTGKATSAPIWVYRIPSLVGIVAAVLALFWLARAFLTPFGAGVAAFLLTISILPGVEARIAKTDGFLLFIILLAQGVLARAWLSQGDAISRRLWILFWTALGVGVLIKGPIILLITGLTIISLAIMDRSLALLRSLKPLSGLGVSFIIAAPWFLAIGFISNGEFFIEAGLVDFLGKVTSVHESHGGIPGLYAAIMIGTFWPTSLLFIAALPFQFKFWNARPILFAVAWVIPSWLVFEFTPTKLPHYILPLYPAFALVVGYAIQNVWYLTSKWQQLLVGLIFVIPIILGTIAFGGLAYLESQISLPIAGLTLLAGGLGFLTWRQLISQKDLSQAFPLLAATCFLTYLIVYQFTFPQLQTIWLSNRMVSALEQQTTRADCPAPSVISVGYNEPSLAFLGPLDMRFHPAEQTQALLLEEPCRRVFVTEQHREKILNITDKGLSLIPLVAIEGFKLNGGNNVTITLYEAKSESQQQ